MPNLSGKWTQTQVLYNDIGWYKIPDAPTSISAETGDTQLVVSFTAPTYTGNPASIIDYRVRGIEQSGRTIPVTVVNAGSGNKYNMDGSAQPALTLIEGHTYIFDQSAASNSGHPLRFSTVSDGTHGGGSEYTTGVTTAGTPGNSGAYTQIVVAADAPTLYYYCTNHSGMGGTANTSTFSSEVIGSASPLTLTGLVNDVVYNIQVQAQNTAGYGAIGSTTGTPEEPQQAIYQIPGSYTWVAPSNLSPSTVSVVAIGGGGGAGAYGGGGGGAGLAYGNGISVSGGTSYTVVVGDGTAPAANGSTAATGASSYFSSPSVLEAKGGNGGQSQYSPPGNASGGGPSSSSGGSALSGGGTGGGGGSNGPRSNNWSGAGGGGAGGYTGNGGTGGDAGSNSAQNGSSAPSGGGGGGGGGGADPSTTGYGYGGGGGGTGIFGQGASGIGGDAFTDGRSSGAENEGGGGSGGGQGSNTFSGYGQDTVANGSATLSGSSTPPGGSGGQYGGGAGNGYRKGASGVVRIVWSRSNQTRDFPSTNVGDF